MKLSLSSLGGWDGGTDTYLNGKHIVFIICKCWMQAVAMVMAEAWVEAGLKG